MGCTASSAVHDSRNSVKLMHSASPTQWKSTQPRLQCLEIVQVLQPSMSQYAALVNATFLELLINGNTSISWGERSGEDCISYAMYDDKHVTIMASADGPKLAGDAAWTCLGNLIGCETHLIDMTTTSVVVVDITAGWLVIVSSTDWKITVSNNNSSLSFWDVYTKDSQQQEEGQIIVRTVESYSQQWEHYYHVSVISPSFIALYLQSTKLLAVSSDCTTEELTLFDELEFGSLLGRGGFGCVYRALWKEQVVAAKIVDGSDICQEVQIGMRLDHPNVVRTLATATKCTEISEVQTVIVLELCDRGSLRSFVDGRQHCHADDSYDVGKILSLLLDIVKGLTYLHEHHIIHGDLSMNNVLLTPTLCAKISDFGLSKMFRGQTLKTRSHGVITHMAPEVLMSGLVSFASDVYSVGVITCEMFTKGALYPPMTHVQMLKAKSQEDPVNLIPVDMPHELTPLIKECLIPDYHKRIPLGTLFDRLVDFEDNRTVGSKGWCGE